jgi:hypothetical protein
MDLKDFFLIVRTYSMTCTEEIQITWFNLEVKSTHLDQSINAQ